MVWIDQSIGGRAGMALAAALAGYALGCFATGYYLTRWKLGKDIRELGSKNIGARNAGRALGRPGFFLTLAGDLAKGTLAVGLAALLTHDSRCGLLALIAVVLGHLWPVQLGFRGGKGIATSLGGLVFFPSILGSFLGLFLLGFAIFRKTVLAGLFAYGLLPVACYFINGDWAQVAGFSILAALIFFAHRRNAIEEFSQFLSTHAAPPKPETSSK